MQLFTDFATPASAMVPLKEVRVPITAPVQLIQEEAVPHLRDEALRFLESREQVGHTGAAVRDVYHRSTVFKEMIHHPQLLTALSKAAGKPIVPYPIHQDSVQINFVVPTEAHTTEDTEGLDHVVVDTTGPAPPSDQQKLSTLWHVDTPDYVLVLLLSDMLEDGCRGGELRALAGASLADDWNAVRANPAAPANTIKARLHRAGQAMFMRGSEVVHSVSSLCRHQREPRITVVFSFQDQDNTAADALTLNLYSPVHPVARREFLEWHMSQLWRDLYVLRDTERAAQRVARVVAVTGIQVSDEKAATLSRMA